MEIAFPPKFDNYRLREHRHGGYQRLVRQVRQAKRELLNGTKFDRLFGYRMANLHYLAAEDELVPRMKCPSGWDLLPRRENTLELVVKPFWQGIGIEEQLIFLQRIGAKKSAVED